MELAWKYKKNIHVLIIIVIKADPPGIVNKIKNNCCNSGRSAFLDIQIKDRLMIGFTSAVCHVQRRAYTQNDINGIPRISHNAYHHHHHHRTHCRKPRFTLLHHLFDILLELLKPSPARFILRCGGESSLDFCAEILACVATIVPTCR